MSHLTWHVRDRGTKRGPFSLDQIQLMYRRGQINRFHEVSDDGGLTWTKAATLLDPPAPVPTPQPTENPNPSAALNLEHATESTPTGTSSWHVATDDSSLSSDRTRAKKQYKNLKLLTILSIPCVLAAIALAGWAIWYRGSLGGISALSGGKVATLRSVKDNDDDIAGAVGLVVIGIETRKADGTEDELTLSTGTCFAITKDGYLLTNRHVVEFADQMSKAKDLDHRKILLFELLNAKELDAAERTDPKKYEDLREEIRKKAVSLDFTKFDPRITVYFKRQNGKRDKQKARIVMVCEKGGFDMAILKVEREHEPFFSLAAADAKVKQGTEVVSIGFPGAAREALSDQEKAEGNARKQTAKRFDMSEGDRTFQFVTNRGFVSLVTHEGVGEGNKKWIQHSAFINPGNSGGPLATLNGTVVGINTQYLKGAEGTYHALEIGQLIELLEENHVEGFVLTKSL